ncbi:MAG: glycosyltransferase family 1 protein [Bacteroidetes bacterium]|nr:glycosyltransferase family 1 protein [Bacteroidota bacterium]
MKILLVGEYSRLHNSLKEGLQLLGHQTTLIAAGDYFKNFPADINLYRKYDSGFSKKIKVGLYKLFGIDITSLSLKKQFFKHRQKLKDYDVVQLINESPLGATPKIEKQIISFLKQYNNKLFLLSCGTDYISVTYAYEKKFRYSILLPLFNGKVTEKKFAPILKYLKPEFKSLHDFVYENIVGVIASDLDYHIPLKEHPKYLGLIPNPINTEKIVYTPNEIKKRIVIFHGINRANYLKKGNDYFDEALKIIQKKYDDKIHIEIVEDLPYSHYIETYNKAQIVLDQVLAYDQGYNALEAMAKGKVVFTGAEIEFELYYNLNKTVAINALPDANKIAKKLEDLILNPEKITEIGRNARDFVEKEHHFLSIAKRYCEIWEKT